jgi:DNA-binding CsgD family transcriptional regulator
LKSDVEFKELVNELLDLFVGSNSAEDVCRKVVHSQPFGDLNSDGCFVYLVDSKSEVLRVGGYGRDRIGTGEVISVWDNHPISNSIRDRQSLEHEPDSVLDIPMFVIPFIKDEIPIGAMAITLLEPGVDSLLNHPALGLLPKLGGYYLDTLGLRIGTGSTGPVSLSNSSPEELTTRQLEILKLIGDGLNNAQIAANVLLSESTVRQETIKIYRALGVSGRQEAMVKGRALGLIKKIQPEMAMVTELKPRS